MTNEEVKRELNARGLNKPKPPGELYSMCDGFGRPIDEERYWQSTGLPQAAIERIKEYKRQERAGGG